MRSRNTDISGQKFGYLTAVEETSLRDARGYVIWKCRCDCGAEPLVSYNELKYTNLQSCGCKKKSHNEKLHTYLTHMDGTSLEMLKSKKVPKDNTTGYKGVYFIRGRYVAKIVFQKRQYCLGSYERIEDAVAARAEAEGVLFNGVAEHYQKWKKRADTDPGWATENPVKVTVKKENGKLHVILLPDIPG